MQMKPLTYDSQSQFGWIVSIPRSIAFLFLILSICIFRFLFARHKAGIKD